RRRHRGLRNAYPVATALGTDLIRLVHFDCFKFPSSWANLTRMTQTFIRLLYLCLAVFVFTAPAQTPTPSPTPNPAPPASDIYLVTVKSHNGELKFVTPAKINAAVGYNNQPFFLP